MSAALPLRVPDGLGLGALPIVLRCPSPRTMSWIRGSAKPSNSSLTRPVLKERIDALLDTIRSKVFE